ncbi:TetR/AcrR family transcriptional regulator [Actinoplanes friuliensis]|nr:TetR/AcrR family transcriptional regulator C-terminal domain-containing protein [Actinoplanes friuliensis]
MPKRSDTTRTRLSRESIVASAIDLADAEGLEAVTIRRLAQQHGVTPMAMYWHFNDKDSLLDGLAEHLIAGVELPEPGDGAAWDVQLRLILERFLEAIRPHPAIAALAMRQILAAESGLQMAERVLGLLRQAGFSAVKAAEVGTFLMCAVITLVASDPSPFPRADDEPGQAVRDKRARLEALSPERYPNVIASAPALVTCREQDGYFGLNLDLLVQGVRGISRD